jgi:hypothetical protein
VRAGAGRRGEFAFTVGKRQIGHLHGDHAAHFSFPKDVWRDLFEQGRVVYHPVFPNKAGPAARRITDETDVRDVVQLLRLNYDRVVASHGRQKKNTSPDSSTRLTATPPEARRARRRARRSRPRSR